MKSENKICTLFNIRYPIIQGGMVWVSGGRLAAAVSNAGGLGLIGAGSMRPDLLLHHIEKAQSLTTHPIGVNIPLLYSLAQEQIDVCLKKGIKIFFTSAGSPKKFTSKLKDSGAIVAHVVSNPEMAFKCQEALVDAVVAEGFESGGHNGKEEITTFSLLPQVKKVISIPLIAAGGIASGESLLAAMALGADGVQMGTRFLMSKESSAHDNFKNAILNSHFASTKLQMKKTVPVRLLENHFSKEIQNIEDNFIGNELKNKLTEHLGHGRAKLGMLEGDLDNGELEVGQIASLIKDIPSCEEIIKNLIQEFNLAQRKLGQIKFD